MTAVHVPFGCAIALETCMLLVKPSILICTCGRIPTPSLEMIPEPLSETRLPVTSKELPDNGFALMLSTTSTVIERTLIVLIW